MRAIRMSWTASAMALAAGIGMSQAIAQQASPRPATLIVPYPLGNTSDSTARVFASNFESRFGQKVIIENRPGAGGYAGSAYVARSAPDGRTLPMNALGGMHANVFVKALEVDIGRALAPIAILAVNSAFLIGSGTIPAKNLPGFVTYAKSLEKAPAEANCL